MIVTGLRIAIVCCSSNVVKGIFQRSVVFLSLFLSLVPKLAAQLDQFGVILSDKATPY